VAHAPADGPGPGKVINSLLPQSAIGDCSCGSRLYLRGVCEEIVFSRYFQKTVCGYTGSIFAGVLLQGILFGLGHSYRGKQVIIISVLEFFTAGLAAWRQSLRPR